MSRWRNLDNVWCNWPSRPIGIIEMIGGSYLSASPNISYRVLFDELLIRNYAIHTWSYLPKFDHQKQANIAWKSLRFCRNRLEERIQSSSKIFRVGHSLGCKLHLLAPDSGRNCSGFISISFNNFAANKSIPMINDIAPKLGLNTDFTPNPSDTMKLIKDTYLQPRNLILSFRADRLDESNLLLNSLKERAHDESKKITLNGDHLTPASAGIRKDLLSNWYNSKYNHNNLYRLIEVITSWMKI